MLIEVLKPEENPKVEQKEARKKRRCNSKVVNWTIGIVIVGILIFLNFYFRNFYEYLYELTKRILAERSITTFLNIFLILVFLQMCFIPGISLFIMYVGFITKNYWYSVALIIPTTYVICSLSYFVTKYTVKDVLKRKLSKKWYFQMFYDQSNKKPWQTSFLLRFILIPVTYKNYLISLMNINFLQFIIPSVLFYFPYFSTYILIGMTVSDIRDIFNNDISKAERDVLIVYISINALFILASLVGFYYLIKMTCALKRKYKEEQKLINQSEIEKSQKTPAPEDLHEQLV